MIKSLLGLYQQGRGYPISLLHGWGMNAAVFEPLAQHLADSFAVMRVDLPGYGQSSYLASTRFDQAVDLLAEQLPDGALMGWSMGGLYAIELARRFPQKFPVLVLVSSNPCFVQRKDWVSAVDAAVFKEFSTGLIENWRVTIRRFLGLQMHGAEGERTLIRQISELLLQGGEPGPDVLKSGLDLLLSMDARGALRQVLVPTLVVLGERDTLVPIALAEQLNSINPAIRVECLAGSAHAPFLSHREEFAGLLREFVTSATAG